VQVAQVSIGGRKWWHKCQNVVVNNVSLPGPHTRRRSVVREKKGREKQRRRKGIRQINQIRVRAPACDPMHAACGMNGRKRLSSCEMKSDEWLRGGFIIGNS
jgi:hypothetical protein